MRRLRCSIVAAAALLTLVVFAASAQAEFGLLNPDVTFTDSSGDPVIQAGSHPFAMTTNIEVNTVSTPDGEFPDEQVKNMQIDFPAGLVGTPTPVPPCSSVLFAQMPANPYACPAETVIGTVKVLAGFGPKEGEPTSGRVVNLEAVPGSASKIGFVLLTEPVTIETSVSHEAPYHLVTHITNTPNVAQFYSAAVTLWGVPADDAHDSERFQCGEPSCPVDLEEIPFLTMPRSCTGPLPTFFKADSWLHPGAWTDPIEVLSHDDSEPPAPLGLSGCDQLEFGPTIATETTSAAAGSATGLNFDLEVDDPELTEADGVADSDIEKAVVTLPTGVTTNPSVANGLSACTLGEYESETLGSDPGTGCPQSSKVGSLEVQTPLLPERTLEGSLYVAKQHDNPFDNLLTIYMVIKDPKLGILIRQAGAVEPDPTTGQLTTTFDDLPEIPFSRFHLHFREGDRGPLITPPTCGTFKAEADLYPYAHPSAPVHETAAFSIASGAKGAPCASEESQLPHAPGFAAGTTEPSAGSFSPFVLRINREDGSQQLSSVTATMPEGLLGKLAGIPYCSDQQIAAAAARSKEGQGALEVTSPSCPTASEVGTVDVAAGAGGEPLHVPGHVYLAGPYKGAPLSFAIITPAIAGPFDLGTVAVRTPLYVDLTTTQIKAVSDPIPTILHGLPLDVREITINVSKPDFTLNPTSCEPKSILGTATSTLGAPAPLSQYFQASDCRALGFKPKLSLRLKGGTKRTSHPALSAVLKMQESKTANLAKAAVTLPAAHFIDQAHISNPCTRVQFDAEACPPKSILGKARAFSPLLDKPLEGPVYFRSNGGDRDLPDVVADLRGQIRAVVVGYIDSVKKKGSNISRLRTRFAHVPDARVSKVVISLYGGKKGLLVNSRNICKAPDRAAVKMTAQNGRVSVTHPRVANSCSKKKGKR